MLPVQTKRAGRREIVPYSKGSRDRLLPCKWLSSSTNGGPSFPTALKKTVIITGEEPQVTCGAAGKPTNFPMGTRATYPFSAVRSGLVSSKTCLVVKTTRAPRSGLVLSLFLANVSYHRGKVTRVDRTLKRTLEKFCCQETCKPCL